MKLISINAVFVSALLYLVPTAWAGNDGIHEAMSDHPAAIPDNRTSLNLSPMMKQHQLSNMRSHLEAVQEIVELLGQDRFDDASQIAHKKLGMTPEMEKMCHMFENTEFTALGLGFHNSGDALGDALKTGELSASLSALNTTLQHCVTCHKRFKQ